MVISTSRVPQNGGVGGVWATIPSGGAEKVSAPRRFSRISARVGMSEAGFFCGAGAGASSSPAVARAMRSMPSKGSLA